jgi:hypothetical protein
VLAEIPQQVLEYMQSRNIPPNISEAEAANTTDADVRQLLQKRQSDFAMQSSSSLYPPIPPAYGYNG